MVRSARLEAGTPKTPKSRKEDRAFFGSNFNQLEALAEAASLQRPHLGTHLRQAAMHTDI